MGVRRGVVKTPGGKLVAVTVATDSMGMVNECRLDGDFFIDGDEARSRSLLDDLERTLLACARGAAARVTGTQDGDAPASAGKSRLPRGRTAQSETYGDEKCADIDGWSDALRRTCMRHGGARLVGTDAGAMAWALARAMGLEPVARPGLNGASDKVATETGAAVESAGGCESDPSCAAPRPNTDWPEDWRDRWRVLAPVVIHDRPRSPIEQMTVDRQWAREVAAGARPASVRFWEWTSPAVVVGRFQSIPDEVHTDLHECLGHGSGQLLPGVPAGALGEYSSTLEEARADLFGLYYMADPKLVELGVLPDGEAYKAEYSSYIRNGIMVQFNRIELGRQNTEAHMQNRKLIAEWCYEHGLKDNVIEKKVRDGKTYFVVNDFETLRGLFAELLGEVQRIKSEGDYEAGKALVEKYAVNIDPELHKEVKERYESLGLKPYGGFVNPDIVPVMEGGKVVDYRIEYVSDYVGQMLEYGRKYSTV